MSAGPALRVPRVNFFSCRVHVHLGAKKTKVGVRRKSSLFSMATCPPEGGTRKRCCVFMTASGCAIHDIRTYPASTIAPSPSKRLCTEVNTNALIYEWTLDGVDPEHPLFGTPYFGQVVRRGLTHEEMFQARKQKHVNDARRDPKESGLHWAIRVFGVNSFTVRIVETTRLPRVQAMEWANEREVALIDENGGVMRDCEPRTPIRQTFNLTSGGQGDPHKTWEGLQAFSRKKLMRVWPKLEAYYEEHKHLRVPRSHPELGSVVHTIRSRNDFLGHADFKKWLYERNFVYDAPRAHLEEDVWPKLEAFYEEYEHLRVPRRHPELGKIVNNIRSRNDFLGHADFRSWLYERDFTMHAKDAVKNAEKWAKVNGKTVVA